MGIYPGTWTPTFANYEKVGLDSVWLNYIRGFVKPDHENWRGDPQHSNKSLFELLPLCVAKSWVTINDHYPPGWCFGKKIFSIIYGIFFSIIYGIKKNIIYGIIIPLTFIFFRGAQSTNQPPFVGWCPPFLDGENPHENLNTILPDLQGWMTPEGSFWMAHVVGERFCIAI